MCLSAPFCSGTLFYIWKTLYRRGISLDLIESFFLIWLSGVKFAEFVGGGSKLSQQEKEKINNQK
jgi:hypothetical protein